MTTALLPLFEGLSTLNADRPVYSVTPVPGYPIYYVGKDNDGYACLLLSVFTKEVKRDAAIRLEGIEVVFQIPSVIRHAGKLSEGTFTIIRCRSADVEVIRYFFFVVETLLRILGPSPNSISVESVINRLIGIFQRLQLPATRSVNGLFGELFFMRKCSNPFRVVAAWRINDNSRFDFNSGSIRLEIKTAGGRQRVHTFSYDQCNPPSGTIAVVASLFVEQATDGTSLRDLIRDIEVLIISNTDLVLKLHDNVAETLGQSLQTALRMRFDIRLADSTLQFYDLRSVPALRIAPPPGVSDIHFRSDLSNCPQADMKTFLEREPLLADFLPEV